MSAHGKDSCWLRQGATDRQRWRWGRFQQCGQHTAQPTEWRDQRRGDNGNYANAVSLKIGSTISNGLNLGTASTATLTLTDGATFSGALTKASDGTWIIDQALTSSGGTTINARVLAATHTTGLATGTGAVVVNSGGTLAGSGTVAGAATVRSSGDAWRLTDKRSAARSRC